MKEQILKLRSEGKTYSEIQFQLGCSKSTISFHCGEKGKLGKRKKKEKIIKPSKKILTNCLYCNSEFETVPSRNKKFCNLICNNLYTNTTKNIIYIDKWKKGEISGGGKVGYGKISPIIRRYLFNIFDNKCSICGWSEINPYTKTIPLEVEHIDGDPENHSENNLTLLCPNCHSLTRGHSSKKSSGRRYYRNKYLKEVGKLGLEPK